MDITQQRLVSLALLFATKKDPQQLCRALAQAGVVVDAACHSVELLQVTESGRLKSIASFGTQPRTSPDESIYGEGLIADAMRKRKPVSSVNPDETVTAVPLVSQYPEGVLVLSHNSQPPSWPSQSAELFGILGALYLQTQEQPHPASSVDLSPRQFEVLQLMAQGMTNQEMALKTATSTSNIAQTCSVLYRKLGVSDRSSAIASAKELGLLRSAA